MSTLPRWLKNFCSSYGSSHLLPALPCLPCQRDKSTLKHVSSWTRTSAQMEKEDSASFGGCGVEGVLNSLKDTAEQSFWFRMTKEWSFWLSSGFAPIYGMNEYMEFWNVIPAILLNLIQSFFPWYVKVIMSMDFHSGEFNWWRTGVGNLPFGVFLVNCWLWCRRWGWSSWLFSLSLL